MLARVEIERLIAIGKAVLEEEEVKDDNEDEMLL